MLRRLVILGVLAVAAFLIWDNRQQIAFLTGLDNNQLRIQGDWYEVVAEFAERDVYTFSEDVVYRNGETCGQYKFTSYQGLQVTIDDQTVSYTVEFPDEENMVWYTVERGEPVPSRRWRR